MAPDRLPPGSGDSDGKLPGLQPLPAPPGDLLTVPTTAESTHASESGRERRIIVPAIDGFRGLAALSVVLYHVCYAAGLPALGGARSILMSGYMGVDFFFVISGFVLFLPVVIAGGRFGDVRAYAVRRAARIVPAYYVALVAVVILQPLLNPERTPLPWNTKAGALSFLVHLSFLQHSLGVLRGYPEGFIVLGVAWTLSLEVTFYVLLPAVARWYFRHPFAGFAIAVVASVLWKIVATHASITVWFLPGTTSTSLLRGTLVTQFPTYLADFAAGMTAAFLFVKWRRLGTLWLPRAAVAAQTVSIVVIVWTMRVGGLRDLAKTAGPYDHWTGTLPVGIAFAVLVLATALAPRWAQLPVANPAARRLGDVSYGVYLWHSVVIGFALTTLHFSQDATTGAFLRILVVTLGASLLIGCASLVWVEQPVIAWARRRSRRIEERGGSGTSEPADTLKSQPLQ